ncbi:MFS transporter [Haladaptatus pallidirubidus]|uniref:MFS transporter n=1 Tax=Haladaptatus pallidirubidus TaxID=1008152 RepID=A0AAV3UFY1_9EURY|nr:MFS transporter [Haladaptatus pallidirubidus]
MATEDESVDVLEPFRQYVSLERDVLVLSVAMFAFSLGFQMTGRYMGRYLSLLGATSLVIGLYGSFGNLIGAVYPYPGGALSDRIGSRTALTLFGFCSTIGFLFWVGAPDLPSFSGVPTWAWIFVGLLLVQAWKSFGLGATFAIVKQSVPPSKFAQGFASTETFRRTAFLIGPLVAASLIAAYEFELGFRYVLAVGAVFALLATLAQHVLYEASEDSLGKSFAGVSQIADDLKGMPAPLRPLLVGDTMVRFANGMVYVFVVLAVTEYLQVDATLPFVGYLGPEAFFGVLLAIEMAVALLTMLPVSKLAERIGLKPVVGIGFVVYAIFPALLVNAPANAGIVALLFAFSGLRFAGLPAHKALIVGPAGENAGGRVVGSYYLVRNTITIPSAAFGGWLYGIESTPLFGFAAVNGPILAFGLATVVGIAGTAYFLVFGQELDAYA